MLDYIHFFLTTITNSIVTATAAIIIEIIYAYIPYIGTKNQIARILMAQPVRLQANVRLAFPNPFTILLSKLEVYIKGHKILRIRI